ncbi:hypothetical protein [Bdellovibrio bacteriovorus]|uniref:hypothetical protein n=1 Tax=Bdellovibrio bacteriovorus TaxID=959 RepID=UPI0035A5E986
MRLILSAALVLLSGCSLLGQRSQPDENQAVRATEISQISNAEKVLNNGSFEQSLILYKEFQGLHPAVHLRPGSPPWGSAVFGRP